MVIAAVASNSIKNRYSLGTVKLGIKELLNKEQTGFKELFVDYQLKKTFVWDPVPNLE